uniref:DUF5672 domain-containing protein n=1 Tax=viral metagenome TaxID=1070528 RepID=A0A6C0KUA8_9ZZZZ
MSACTAVIVEPRNHPALSFVLQNVVTNLPNNWKILIFHGNQNKEVVEHILAELPSSRFLTPIKLNVDNLTITQYNAILMSSAFYNCIPTETMLIFQTDTMILEPMLLDTFLSHDYVGAPWPSGNVGNGGLSLRKKSKMITITQTVLPFHENEDIYFSIQNIVPLHKPSFEEAKQFAVETVFYENPFGIHAPWKYLSIDEMHILIKKYPTIMQLMHLQSL